MFVRASQLGIGDRAVRLRVRDLNPFVFSFKTAFLAPRALSLEALQTFCATPRTGEDPHRAERQSG
jgi:hypothetical protein